MTKFYIPSHGPASWQELLAGSVSSLAICWEESRGFPESVSRVFKASPYPLFHTLEFTLGIPGHKIELPPAGGPPPQNDLFVLGRSGDELISIAVAGRYSGPFGKRVSEWDTEPSSGGLQRLEFLVDLLEINNKDISKIRYQLLHRTASALLEAQRFCAPHALLLVHSFSHGHQGFEDYAALAALYGQTAGPDAIVYTGDISGINLYLAWVTGEAEYMEKK